MDCIFFKKVMLVTANVLGIMCMYFKNMQLVLYEKDRGHFCLCNVLLILPYRRIQL